MTSREDELKAQIAELEGDLDRLPPIERMSASEFAKAAGLSGATAGRIMAGHAGTSLGNLKKALPFLGECPCCSQKLEPPAPLSNGKRPKLGLREVKPKRANTATVLAAADKGPQEAAEKAPEPEDGQD